MDHATLVIEAAGGTLKQTWAGSPGLALSRERLVHASDVAAASRALDKAPESLADLEAIGGRIFGRLLDREIREAAFASPLTPLLIHSDLPIIPWDLAWSCGRFLADVRGVGRAPDVAFAPRTGSLRVLVVADPTGDLPYSAGEARQLADRLLATGRVAVEAMSGPSATRDAVLDALQTGRHDIIHLSCHAEHNADSPLHSFVRMFDGPLTAEDVYQADLSAVPVLCVLNACGSGRTSGAGVSGLASAFRQAGAAAAVGARWPVNNKSAAYWMAAFYASLASGDTIGDAVRCARSETRKLFFNDPLLTWAAFALDGAPWNRLLESGERVKARRGPLVGREAQLSDLNTAWAEACAGLGRIVLLIGPPGCGKSRLMDDWLASLPRDAVRRAAPRDQLDVSAVSAWARERAGGVLAADTGHWAARDARRLLAVGRAACHDAPLLVLTTAREVSELRLHRDEAQIIPVPLLGGNHLRSLFAAFDASAPAGVHRATPADVERIALGLPRDTSMAVLVAALSPAQRSVLRAGAVWGDGFSADNVALLTRKANSALWRPLEALCAAAWIVEEQPGRFRFRDTADRQAVLEAFRPAGERVEWERRAAESRESTGEHGEAGRHWLNAGDDSRASAEFAAAVLGARSAGEALEWRSALVHIGPEPADAGYLERIAWALETTGRWPEAQAAYHRVAGACAGRPSARAAALVEAARCATRAGDTLDASAVLDQAEALSGVTARSLTARSELLLAKCLASDALDAARRALTLARGSDDADATARAALAASNAALLGALPKDAIAMCEIGLNVASGATNPNRTALIRELAQARQYAGDYAAAEQTLRNLRDEQCLVDEPRERAGTLLALAQLWRDQGRLEDAITALDEVAGLAGQAGEASVRAEAFNVRSSVERRMGRYADAHDAAERAYSTASKAGHVAEAIRADVHIATALAEQGSLAEARERALEAEREATAAGYLFAAAWASTVAGMAALEADARDEAQVCLTRALQTSTAIHGHIGVASANLYLGWVAMARGEDAGEVFERAASVAGRISYRAAQHTAEFGAALAQGRPDAADQPLRHIEGLNMGAVVPWLREKRGAFLLADRRYEEALRDLAPAYRVSRRIGMLMVQARCAAGLAAAYGATGDPMADAMRLEAALLRARCLEGW